MFQSIRLKPRRNQSETCTGGTVEELESRRLLSAGQLGLQPNLIEGMGGSLASDVSQSTQISGQAPTKTDRTDALKELHAIGNSAGPGQTIVIVSAYDDPNITSDLKVFDAEFELPDAEITQVGQAGDSPASYGVDAAWALETSLDVEWAHAIRRQRTFFWSTAKMPISIISLPRVNTLRTSRMSRPFQWAGATVNFKARRILILIPARQREAVQLPRRFFNKLRALRNPSQARRPRLSTCQCTIRFAIREQLAGRKSADRVAELLNGRRWRRWLIRFA